MSNSNLDGLSLFANMGANQDDDTDVEAELEVDQLDSDTDPDEPADSTKSRKTKNGSHRPGERIPGHTLLPAVKLENMIQAEGTSIPTSLFSLTIMNKSIGVTGNMALSKEGLFVLSIATVRIFSFSRRQSCPTNHSLGGIHQEIGTSWSQRSKCSLSKPDQLY